MLSTGFDIYRRLGLVVFVSILFSLGATTAARGGDPDPTAAPVMPAHASECSTPAEQPSARTAPAADPRYVRITFTNECGTVVPLFVDLAADDEREQQGLMEVKALPADEGELFIFNNLAGGAEVHVSFWMEHTPIPLSIAFIGKESIVHEIQEMEAESRALHTPSLPYLYAVEANRGWFAAHGITAGAKADLSPALELVAR